MAAKPREIDREMYERLLALPLERRARIEAAIVIRLAKANGGDLLKAMRAYAERLPRARGRKR
jgi:hypothetical protein